MSYTLRHVFVDLAIDAKIEPTKSTVDGGDQKFTRKISRKLFFKETYNFYLPIGHNR